TGSCHGRRPAQPGPAPEDASKHLAAGRPRGRRERAKRRIGQIMSEYVAILEQGARNWSAYVPDLPGCVAAGDTREEAERLIREAVSFHIEGLREEGLPVPQPHSLALTIAAG